MKKMSIILLAAALCFAAGCTGTGNQPAESSAQSTVSDTENNTPQSSSNPENSNTESSNPESSSYQEGVPESATVTEVTDKDGKRLGEIRTSSPAVLTDMGIFYYSSHLSETDTGTATASTAMSEEKVTYYLFNPESNKNYKLGEAEDQSYEAGYARVELSGKMYTLITKGNPLDATPDPLVLLEFDLKEHTMKQYTVSENGFPYTAMTAFDGKLVIINHDQTETLHDKVYLFDPQTGKMEEKLDFELKDSKGETIRQVCGDGNDLYILRLHFESDSEVSMMLDKYDTDFKKQSEKDITSILKDSAGDTLTAEDVTNEMKQMVSRFLILDGKYVYYENFSTTRFLAEIENGRLFDEAGNSNSSFSASSGSGKPFFYIIYGGTGEENRNAVYEWDGGKLNKTVFEPEDSRYYIISASASPSGSRLIHAEFMIHAEFRDTENTITQKLYYLK